MRTLILSLFIAFTLVSSKVYAQPIPPNCPPSYSASYDIIGDSVSFCLDGVNLTVIPSGTLFSTDQYNVNSIPYNPYPWVGGNQILVGQDDIWSGVVPLPFPFCFFGQKYNAVVIGANGQVGFDVTQAGMGNAWASAGWVAPNPNAAMNNTIMAPYHDVDPSVFYAGSSITWDIYGTAPCRYMVISWDSIPMFSCNSMLASQQVVLFESTYLIDINIKEKPLCSTWNSGTAHQGIQNANGTAAFMVPGRNGTQWTATNDSWRFTPSGTIALNWQYFWIDVPTGDTLGTGPTLSYFPTQSSQVTVAAYAQTDCDTIQAFFNDTIDVIVTGNVVADFNSQIKLGCIDDTVTFTNTSTSTIGVPTYFWSFGDGTFSTATDTTKVYFNQGVYNVMLIASDNGCHDTVTKSIDLNHPIDALFRVHDGTIPTPGVVDSFCLGETVHLDAQASVPQGFLSYAWDFGDGQTQTTLANSVTHVYSAPGVYTIRLVVTDTLGCIDSVSHGVYIDNPPYVNFTMSDDKVCVGEPIQFTDTVAPFTKSIIWNFGDGSSIIDVHNPSHSWSAAGTPYSVSLTGTYYICPDLTVTKDVYVYNYPSVNLGPDTSICPGVTGAIQLANLAGGGGSYQWSTGETASSILVTQPGYYWLQATEPNAGCISADTIWVKRDCYVNIPNSFSPNGDGLNDYFLPRNLLSSGLRTFTMNIYNRWGEKIFYTTSIDGRGWDGKFGGVDQPQGVFVYTIDVEFQNGMKKNYKGNVTLMR